MEILKSSHEGRIYSVQTKAERNEERKQRLPWADCQPGFSIAVSPGEINLLSLPILLHTQRKLGRHFVPYWHANGVIELVRVH